MLGEVAVRSDWATMTGNKNDPLSTPIAHPPPSPGEHALPTPPLPDSPRSQPARPTARKMLVPALVVSMVLLLALVVGLGWRALGGVASRGLDDGAIVKVVSGSRQGSGFFIQDPRGEGVLVVTAFHVIETGESAVVQRIVPVSGDATFTAAYPDTELVAFDAQADIAVLRIRNLPRGELPTLELAAAPIKEAQILSAGFPASSLTSRVGLLKKEGKVLDLIRLPVIDRVTGRVLREDATEGLIVSSELEQGQSGGPSCDEQGRVVGINVVKDTQHRAQNGAVSVTVLSRVLSESKTFQQPKAEDIVALLQRIQNQYLMLALDDRSGAPETDVISLQDLPDLRGLAKEIRYLSSDEREVVFSDNIKVTGKAMLGLLTSRLPGRALETFSASSTQSQLADCEARDQIIRRFWGDGVEKSTNTADCLRLGVRALAWDLTAVALEWSGKTREMSVTKIEEVDQESKVFRATVRMSELPVLVPIHVAWEGGHWKLKLFNRQGELLSLSNSRSLDLQELAGVWSHKTGRHPSPEAPSVDTEAEDRLTISVKESDRVSIAHEYRRVRHASRGNLRFACNHRKDITDSGRLLLAGVVKNGVVVGTFTHLERTTDDCEKCSLCTPAPKLFVLKLHDNKVYLYETAGKDAPEPRVFERQNRESHE